MYHWKGTILALCLIPFTTELRAQDAAGIPPGQRQEESVCGKVVHTSLVGEHQDEAVYLHLKSDQYEQVKLVFISKENQDKFYYPPQETYYRLRICVRGQTSDNQKKAHIEVRSPLQFSLQGDSQTERGIKALLNKVSYFFSTLVDKVEN